MVVASGILVAYLLGIVGRTDPETWKYEVEGACPDSGLPSFGTIIDEKKDLTITRVDALNRSNPLDSGDLDPIFSGGCQRLELNAPGLLHHLFIMSGRRNNNHDPYQQHKTLLKEGQICRETIPDLDDMEVERVYVIARKVTGEDHATLRSLCPDREHAVDGPIFVIGGEMQGTPRYLDFSRQGAYISVSLDGYQASRAIEHKTSVLHQKMIFWLLIPPEHTLLVQQTTPAPTAVIPTNAGTLFQFSIPLLSFPKGGEPGGQFLAGALSFVYESDIRASLRDYLVFVLAAIFAFALERFVEALGQHKRSKQ